MAVAVEKKPIGEFSFIWRIENFSFCLQCVGECIKSPLISIQNAAKTYFLLLFPRGVDDDRAVCRLCYGDNTLSKIDNEISIRIADGDFSNPSETECSWIRIDKIPLSGFFDYKEYPLLSNDTLTIGFNSWNEARNKHNLGNSAARTRIGIESSFFTWEVKEFGNFLPLREIVHSFESLSGHPEMTMQIFLTKEESIQLEIIQAGVMTCNLVVCKISLLDVRGDTAKSIQKEHRFQVSTGEQICTFPPFISKTSLMVDKDILLPNDVLCLQFEVVTSIGIASNRFEDKDINYLSSSTKLFNEVNSTVYVDPNKTTSNNLKNDLLSLYEQKKFCDVTLQVGSSAFPVHKSILCARSPVFFSMFERDMTENQTGIVDIPDLDADTVQRMILFLYTDTVPELDLDSASELYFAADKYRILSLRGRCASFMKSQLESGNVCHALVLADRHRDDDLKLACQKFILNYVREIITSNEWKEFEKNNHELTIETFRFLCLNKF